MDFLIAFLVVLASTTIGVVRDLVPATRVGWLAWARRLLLAIGSATFGWPLIANGHAFHLGAANLSVPGFLLFGGLGAAIYGHLIWVRRGGSFASLGVPVLASAASLYIVAACVDHYWFFRGDPNNLGVMDASVMPDVRAETGCSHVILLRSDPSAVTYRCQETVLFGGFFSQWPFIPWPDYREGRSAALKKTIDDLQASARKIE